MSAPWPRNPVIYEINTRIWLRELSAKRGAPVTLATVPDEEIRELGRLGFDALWLMGVWRPSPASERIARSHAGLRDEFRRALPDLVEEDIVSSPYSVREYAVSAELGGDAGLAALRTRLRKAGLRIVLDFVPNHTATDHDWVHLDPDLYVRGTEDDGRRDPDSFFRASSQSGPAVIAHGRDPYFPAWTDTAQLNYRNPRTRKRMTGVLSRLAQMADGVRCDMAMLVLEAVHERVWGERLFMRLDAGTAPASEFWGEALAQVRRDHPHVLFLAEAYWAMEGELQRLGFDYTYDKALYDWMRSCRGEAITPYLLQSRAYQERCLRFLENHDEERAAAAFENGHGRCAALLCAALPGAHLYHDGQLEGRRIRVPVQLRRRPFEPGDPELRAFYGKLLSLASSALFREGDWTPLCARQAWERNESCRCFAASLWRRGDEMVLAAANLSRCPSQGYVPLPFDELRGRKWVLEDLLGGEVYERDGDELFARGLFLDVGPWRGHLFRFTP